LKESILLIRDKDKAAPGPGRLCLPPDALALGIHLRRQGAEDEPFLDRLFISTRWEELQVVPWPDDGKLAFLIQQRRFQAGHYATHYADAAFDVVEVAGLPAGRLYLLRTRGDFRVVDISLLPEFRGQGIGEALLRAVGAEARAAGARVSVHVEVVNRARRLYERIGFIQVADKGPYLLMEWTP
jgi:ribosomal protein S18 acetylase RimI-like enzyme